MRADGSAIRTARVRGWIDHDAVEGAQRFEVCVEMACFGTLGGTVVRTLSYAVSSAPWKDGGIRGLWSYMRVVITTLPPIATKYCPEYAQAVSEEKDRKVHRKPKLRHTQIAFPYLCMRKSMKVT